LVKGKTSSLIRVSFIWNINKIRGFALKRLKSNWETMSVSSDKVRNVAQQPWKSISNICKDAAVFLDDCCAELLHWAGGVELLGGTVGIYNLYGDLTQIARDFIASVSSVVAYQ